MIKKFIPLAKKVIDLEIQALQKLKKKIDNSFNKAVVEIAKCKSKVCLLYTSPSPRDGLLSRMPSSA